MKKIWKSIVAVFACSSLMVSMPVSAAEDGNAQKLKEGSFAFFQDAGADEALDALNNSQYAELTIKGDADDATSFDNMLKSFQWIRRCNELREMNGLEPLLVNNEMMAMAQADANYSDTVIGHAQQFAVGENCAWNWGKTDPFIQWYDEEKEIYDQMETPGWTSETGHYLNIIEPGYKTTGFAINTRGTKYPCTYVQVFSYSDDGITVDEYEKIVMDYYNSITSNETPDSEDDTDNSGSDDNNGSGDNSGSDDNNGSGDNSGSDDNNGSGDNSGSDDNNGSGDNSGSDDNNGSGDNNGSDDNNGSGDNSGSNDNNGSGDNSGSDDNNGSGDNNGSDDNNGSGDKNTEGGSASLNVIEEMIQSAAPKSVISVTKEQGINTLSNGVMQMLVERGDVTLEMEYTYQDKEYHIVIPAGKAVNSDISWYGPLYLAANYGNGAISVGGNYVVKQGDTLWKIARANQMTVDQVAAKNPQIKDVNFIKEGQKITLK